MLSVKKEFKKRTSKDRVYKSYLLFLPAICGPQREKILAITFLFFPHKVKEIYMFGQLETAAFQKTTVTATVILQVSTPCPWAQSVPADYARGTMRTAPPRWL